MAWMNYRKTLSRFSHIDAQFVRASCDLRPGEGAVEVVVRFYPWWEHPLYEAARDRGDDWGFAAFDSGVREVTVRAVRPWTARLSRRYEVVEWAFTEEHPLLWQFAEEATIYVNAPFQPEAVTDYLLSLDLPFVSRSDLISYLYSHAPEVSPRGIKVPAPLYGRILAAFEHLGVPTFAPHTPGPPRPATVFLLDDDDYVIADDFEIDVPEFHHDPSWFSPDPKNREAG